MNPKFYSKVPSGLFSGRVILIALLVVLSSTTFILGYFVGKMGREEKPTSLNTFTLKTDLEKESDTSPQTDITEKQLGEIMEGRENSEPEDTVETKESTPAAPEEESQKAKNTKKEAIKTTPKEVKKQVKKVARNTATNRKVDYYTIQAGAFNSLTQAKRLEKKITDSGYPVQIVKAVNNKKTLYKVRVGRYKSRKEAEISAIRLTRNLGVKTFVLKEKNR
ncbi:MAG: SPOR domain-containing protein [Nitrospirae bacterium]|nr:MAG: SPOR domain-containing protein [Nitrospirota bacterium]